MKVKINQKFTRLLAGVVPIKVFVESIDTENNTFMANVEDGPIPEGKGWTFDIKTGMEIDEDLNWGPKYKNTGSYIKEIVDENINS